MALKKRIAKIHLLLLFSSFTATLFGQRTDYYLTDSLSFFSGSGLLIDARDKGNSQFATVKSGKESIIKLSPDEVSEYGFANKRVYVSREIRIDDTTRRVFLERLTDGKISLYYYRGNSKLFFIEKDDSSLIEISKNEGNEKSTYIARLREITEDCPGMAEVADFVGYSKKSMQLFFNRYKKCELRPFPRFRYGVKAGYELSKFIYPAQPKRRTYPLWDGYDWSQYIDSPHPLGLFDFKYEGAFTVGLFVDMPISVSDFSLNLSINYSRHGYSYNIITDNKDYDFVANLSSLKVPILVRYSLPSNKYRYFVQSGGVVEYNFNKNAHLYESNIESNTIAIEKRKIAEISDCRLGFSIGTGLEYRVTKRNSLFLELSFNQLYGDIRSRDISLTMGVNL
jgi:hypothetical protein